MSRVRSARGDGMPQLWYPDKLYGSVQQRHITGYRTGSFCERDHSFINCKTAGSIPSELCTVHIPASGKDFSPPASKTISSEILSNKCAPHPALNSSHSARRWLRV